MGTRLGKAARRLRMVRNRRPSDPPAAIAADGWRYHHVGIPCAAPHADEHHIVHLGVHVRGFESSPYGIEWMRFEPDCPLPDPVRHIPHVAFVVDDLDEALEGKVVLIAPNAPSRGVRVAFILDDGAPVELMQFGGTAQRRRRTRRAAERPAVARLEER
jgi:hypothetical protein